MNIQDFTDAYIECAIWTLTDAEGEPCDWADEQDIDPTTLETLRADARDFAENNSHMIEGREDEAGHDFWLNRNGHGAGFWDGDWPEHGAELDAASRIYGSHDLFLGNDLRIY